MVLGNRQVQPDSHYRRLVFFKDMSVHNGFVLELPRLVLRPTYFISLQPKPNATPDEQALVLLTRIHPVCKTIGRCLKRWRIECLFLHLKTNGFGLVDLSLKPASKSNLGMALLCLAYPMPI
jgi:hypothetical protein